MNTSRSLAIGVAVVASAAIVGVLTTSVPADAQGQRVATAVDIVSSIPLNMSGNVALVPGGTVNIGNSPTSPVLVRNVDDAAKEIFQHMTTPTSFNSSASTVDVITVPSGRLLVIEHFSAWVNASGPDGLASISLGIQNVGQFNQAPCQQTGQTANGLNHFFSCATPTKYYVGPGQTLQFLVSVANSDGGFHRTTVSGYFVPVS